MRVDQTAAVFRVGRRRLARHITALRVHLAEARHVLAIGKLEPEPHAALLRTVLRLETNVSELELALQAAPKIDPPDHSQAYVAWARD